ncbi:MAG: DUF3658 domain-containing protein [Acidobacteriota bacterium]
MRPSTDTEKKINDLLSETIDSLGKAMMLARELDEEAGKLVSQYLGSAIASTLYAGTIVCDGTDLERIPEDDEPLTPEEQARVDLLTADEIQAIDEAILANSSHQFRKIARVVGGSMSLFPDQRGIPDIFYADRVRHLVATGDLEAEGYLPAMGFCEVRLPESHRGQRG